MNRLKKVLIFLFAPSAFKLGALASILISAFAFLYYSGSSIPELRPLFDLTSTLHQRIYDVKLRQRGERPGTDQIALLAIDEEALRVLGRWPWPRKTIADIVERLSSYEAKVLAFDAVFSEPDIPAGKASLTRIREQFATNSPLQDSLNREITKLESDSILAASVAKNADRLVMGYQFNGAPELPQPHQEICLNEYQKLAKEYEHLSSDESPILTIDQSSVETPEEILTQTQAALAQIAQSHQTENSTDYDKVRANEKILYDSMTFCANWPESLTDSQEGLRGPASASDPGSVGRGYLKNAVNPTGSWTINLPEIAQGTKSFGFYNAAPDKDGTIRSGILVARYGDLILPSIGLKSAMKALNLNAMVTISQDVLNPREKGITELALTDPETAEPVFRIPVNTRGEMLINYRGAEKSLYHLSAAELFNNKDTVTVNTRVNGQLTTKEFPKSEFLKDRLFVFGATALGLYDLRVTPFQENFPGPEIHLNILDNILRKDFLYVHPQEAFYMPVGLATVGVALSATVSFMGALSATILTLLLVIAILVIDHYFLFGSGIVVNLVLPLGLVGSLYTFLTFYKYLTEERKKKELKGTFQKYVSPAVVDEILKNPENLNLGGQKKRMSVMFSDVRGFTTISEKLEPTKLSDILNAYLTPMTRLVFEHKGTLDKYMGDAIMAFWGAPMDLPDHAKQACAAALSMMGKLKEINNSFLEQGLPPIDIGIGINTGDMSVGNMGSDIVRSYTVMGDSVNLGSRLEGINKEYGTHIIISEFTHAEVKNDFTCREVDWVRVKGKLQPVRIYELMGEKTNDANVLHHLEAYQKGFEAYHAREWDQAIQHFQNALKINPQDKLSGLYVSRCESFKKNPPPADWDGVFEMKTK